MDHPSSSLITSIQAESCKFSELASYYADWDAHYQQLSAGAFQGALTAVQTPSFNLINDHWNQAILVRGTIPKGMRVISAITHQTTQRYKLNTIENGELITAVGGTEIEYQTHEESDALSLAIPEHLVKEFLTKTGRIAPWSDADEGIIPKSSPRKAIQTGIRWKHCLEKLNRATDLPSADQQVLIHWALNEILDSITDESLSEDPLSIRRKRLEIADQAKDYLEKHCDRPVALGELCSAVDANERTLLLGFKELMGSSPGTYHRALRYNMTRSNLAESTSDTTVTDVATRWGFYHFGRFSTGYRKHFGESPSTTLKNH